MAKRARSVRRLAALQRSAQWIVLLIAVCYVTVNLLVDLAYAFLDPRIRYA